MHSFIKASLVLLGFSWQLQAVLVGEVTQFTNDNNGFAINVATDNKDNFIAAYNDDSTLYGVFSEQGTAWSPPVQLSGTGFVGTSDVAMDQTSTGLAIWSEFDGVTTSVILTSFFNNGTWTPIAAPLETSLVGLANPSIEMNGTGGAVAAWTSSAPFEIHASFFSAGVWFPFQVLGIGGNGITVHYSPNGSAVATWSHFDLGINDIWANYFNGTTWIGPTLLDNAGNSFPDSGIDANGNAFAIWRADGDTNTKVSRFNGAVWSAPIILSSNSFPADPHIAVDLDGTAVAVWVDNPNTAMLSQFNGISWSPPVPFAGATSVNITMDDKGDALITWVTPLSQLFTALLPKGGTLQSPVLVKTSDNVILLVEPALSSRSILGSIVWREGVEGSNVFGTFIAFGPTPPTDIVGATCHAGSDRVNVIAWRPSTDPTIVAYEVRRDGVLVAIVPFNGPFVFYDHSRCRGDINTYSVTAVNAEGIESASVTVTITN